MYHVHICFLYTDELYLLFNRVFFVIICIIFYWWIIKFIFYLNTIGTPIAGPFQLNKSWGICPEFPQWLLGAELKPLGLQAPSVGCWYWLLYHCLLTASKPWIWKGCMSLTSGSYITLFFGVGLWNRLKLWEILINQPVCRNGIHGRRGFFGALNLLCVEVLQKVLWRKTVRVLPLIVWVIVQAQHPWVVCTGFHSSDFEWLVGRCSRYWNLQSSARYEGCVAECTSVCRFCSFQKSPFFWVSRHSQTRGVVQRRRHE